MEILVNDPSKRFTYVEMKFFSMWWKYQSDEMKDKVRQIAQEGRLEFVNAGWSMHDEACTHYEDMIDNMLKGQQFLQNELGIKPTIGWHVDPFGHSSANARLFADMGLDAWFFARLDYQDREERMDKQELQFIWKPFYEHLGDSTQIFTGVMQVHYCWPDGFWYDEKFMGDDPVVSDETLTTFNADVKAKEMYEYAKFELAPHYKGNHVLIPMGCDFSFANAHLNYKSMDRLIAYFNEHYDDATILYSTPTEYLDALRAQEITWPAKYGDMFPYADQPEDYWTGYFTSRPNSKKQVRDGQALMLASGKLFSEDEMIGRNRTLIEKPFDSISDAMGVYQHHDGVSGTAKQYVADDYTR